MSMPGFTAYVCLSGQANYYCYRSEGFKGINESSVLHLQRATGPYGPIGLPGQDWEGACWHMCMISGGDSQWCSSKCTGVLNWYLGAG